MIVVVYVKQRTGEFCYGFVGRGHSDGAENGLYIIGRFLLLHFCLHQNYLYKWCGIAIPETALHGKDLVAQWIR